MLYREIMAVCSEIHIKHINTLCEQNVEFANVKPGGTYSDHWALKDWRNHKCVLLTEDPIKKHNVSRPSPYRAVNTLRLGYTNHQLKLYGEITADGSEIHTRGTF